jgi:hypothetical protein
LHTAGTLPVFFFVGQQAEGLLAAAQAGLQLTNISNLLIDIDADVAMQYSPISTLGPVSMLWCCCLAAACVAEVVCEAACKLLTIVTGKHHTG